MHKLDLNVEPLETRRLLAGNVVAAMQGQDLRIGGDSDANEISIFGLQEVNLVRVQGDNGTTINGAAFVDFFVPGDLDLFLNRGDNQVNITAIQNTGGLKLRDGADNLTLQFTSAQFEDAVSLSTGGGDDTIIFNQGSLGSNQFLNGTRISLAAGNDSILGGVNTTLAGRTDIRTMGGDDTVELAGVIADDLAINTAAGNDAIRLGGAVQNLDIVTSGGNDRIDLLNFSIEFTADLNLGGGNFDFFNAESVDFNSSAIKVRLGGGRDYIIMFDCEADGARFEAFGGGGDEYIDIFDAGNYDLMKIDGQGGDDEVSINQTTFQDLDVKMGGGTDILGLGFVSADSIRANGGGGRDTYFEIGNVFGASTITSFEQLF